MRITVERTEKPIGRSFFIENGEHVLLDIHPADLLYFTLNDLRSCIFFSDVLKNMIGKDLSGTNDPNEKVQSSYAYLRSNHAKGVIGPYPGDVTHMSFDVRVYHENKYILETSALLETSVSPDYTKITGGRYFGNQFINDQWTEEETKEIDLILKKAKEHLLTEKKFAALRLVRENSVLSLLYSPKPYRFY